MYESDLALLFLLNSNNGFTNFAPFIVDVLMKTTDEPKLGQENPPANEKQAIAPHLTQNSKDIVAYHFCQAADPNTLKLGQTFCDRPCSSRSFHPARIETIPIANPSIRRGSQISAHRVDYAADVNPLKVSKMEFARWVNKNCEFDQLILEYGTPSELAWVHISCDPRLKRQVLKTVSRGGYVPVHL